MHVLSGGVVSGGAVLCVQMALNSAKSSLYSVQFSESTLYDNFAHRSCVIGGRMSKTANESPKYFSQNQSKLQVLQEQSKSEHKVFKQP